MRWRRCGWRNWRRGCRGERRLRQSNHYCILEGRAEKEQPMPVAHLIHGFLGAGKTTFAKWLEVELNAVRFSHDEWMARLYGDDPPAERFAAPSANVWDVMQGTWSLCLALGLDVVLDLGFWARDERDSVRSRGADLRARHLLYELNCSE